MYGRPEDCFVRVVDTFAMCGCGVHPVWTSQRVTSRHPIDVASLRVDFDIVETEEA